MIDIVGNILKLKIKNTDTKDLHSAINKLELLDICRMQYQINKECMFFSTKSETLTKVCMYLS